VGGECRFKELAPSSDRVRDRHTAERNAVPSPTSPSRGVSPVGPAMQATAAASVLSRAFDRVRLDVPGGSRSRIGGSSRYRTESRWLGIGSAPSTRPCGCIPLCTEEGAARRGEHHTGLSQEEGNEASRSVRVQHFRRPPTGCVDRAPVEVDLARAEGAGAMTERSTGAYTRVAVDSGPSSSIDSASRPG